MATLELLHSSLRRFLLALALLPLLGSAQTTTATATLQGTIVDTVGGSVAGATIIATNQNTMARRRAASGPAGQYTLRLITSCLAPATLVITAICGSVAGYLWYRVMCWSFRLMRLLPDVSAAR